MNTTWLEDLQALAETLNFSQAAEKRNITQPAFGRRIRSLEDWCGTALVDRSGYRLRLTLAGEIMLEAAADITRRLERVRHDFVQIRAETATVTFAATHALSFVYFPKWIQGLGPATSTMPIRLLSDNMNECERIMLEGQAQFLLCHYHEASGNRLESQNYRYIELSSDQMIPVSGRNEKGEALYSLPGSPEALVPRLAYEEKSGMGRILSRNLSGRGDDLHLRTVFTSHLAMALKALAADGKGVAWIPESLALDEMGPAGRLTPAGPDDWSVDVKIILIRPRARLSEMAERFWDLIQRDSGA